MLECERCPGGATIFVVVHAKPTRESKEFGDAAVVPLHAVQFLACFQNNTLSFGTVALHGFRVSTLQTRE